MESYAIIGVYLTLCGLLVVSFGLGILFGIWATITAQSKIIWPDRKRGIKHGWGTLDVFKNVVLKDEPEKIFFRVDDKK